MIDEIIEDISNRLPFTQPLDFSNIVGLTDQIAKIDPLLDIDSANVRMIGIWGMGGIGKTTIAKYLYEQHKRSFLPYYCFMEKVAKFSDERGLLYLQEQLLSNIFREKNIKLESVEHGRQQVELRLRHLKVFLVLDDVDDVSQVDALAKNTSWFGLGSRIIITTRDRGLLKACRVDNIHEVKFLDDDQSLQMFKQVAFEGGCPPSDGHQQLSVRASQLVQGLPSAIEAFGSYLRGKTTIKEWESSLSRLERNPPRNIMKILKLSYNALEESDKTIFLHIAFLCNRYTVQRVTTLLDDDESETNLGLTNLVDKSLISVSTDGCISMHVLVEQMGREVESERPTSRRRLLRDPKEIHNVLLSQGTETVQIQSMTLHMCEMSRDLTIETDVLESMRNLKFLKFYKHLDDIESKLRARSVQYILPNELRLFHWDAYPLTALPFELQSLIEVNIRYSNLERLGAIALPGFEKLRRLDLTGSRNLLELSGLSTAKKLEELIINGCIRLQEIPESICRLPFLRKLHAGRLNGTTMITDLQEGSLSHRSQIRLTLPNANASLNYLIDLAIEGDIRIDLLGLNGNADVLSFSSPQVIQYFHGFKSLIIKRFNYIEKGASFGCYSFSKFLGLTELSLINLEILEIPEDISELKSLEKLDLSGNHFEFLPASMGQQAKLKYLSLCNCRRLESLPQLAQVERLTLLDCVNLRSLREELPGEEKDPRTYHLLELCLDNCKNVESLSYELSYFNNLTYLDLTSHDFETLPSSIKDLSSLVTLCLNNCKKLISIDELPLSLKYLLANGCLLLESVSLSSNHSIEHLDFGHCFRLNQEEDLITQILNNQHNEAVSPRFACVPATIAATTTLNFWDRQSYGTSLPMIWLSPTSIGFDVCIKVASRICLQFPMLCYTWNSTDEFCITLRPDFYHPHEEDDSTSHQLVIIRLPRSVFTDAFMRVKANLQFPDDIDVSPAKITPCAVRVILSKTSRIHRPELIA